MRARSNPITTTLLALVLAGCDSIATECSVVEELGEQIGEPAPAEQCPATTPSIDPLLGFRFAGEPIHPLALAKLASYPMGPEPAEVVDLSAQPPLARGVSVDADLIEFDDDEPGWTSYRVHDRAGSRFLISVAENTGGTGVFTSVLVVEIRADQLIPTFLIPSGDRCNGGVAERPSFLGEAVLVRRWLTPSDLVAMSSIEADPNDDLEHSANSCIGFLVTRVQRGQEEQVVGFKFTPDRDDRWRGDRSGWTENYSLQSRFNQIYARWIAAGETDLDPAAIDRFVTELLATQN